jgi:hypothetical protein
MVLPPWSSAPSDFRCPFIYLAARPQSPGWRVPPGLQLQIGSVAMKNDYSAVRDQHNASFDAQF